MVHVGTNGGKWGNFYLNGSMYVRSFIVLLLPLL